MKYLRAMLRISCVCFAIAAASTVHAAEFSADSPEIQYFGRWDARDGVYRCGYGATYIKANFTGTSLKADIGGKGIWWRVSIDGGEFRRLSPRGKDTVLARNLPPGEHKVLFVRSTEGQAGISEFRGFTVDDGAALREPDPLKERRLEFVGDSITAGAGLEGVWGGRNAYHDVEDNDMSYGPQLARMLAADYSVIAKSGQGVALNYAEKRPARGVHACDSYAWTFFSNKFGPENLEWDAARFPVDATIVSIGTNDFLSGSVPPSEMEFKEAYKKIIDVVRRKNPGKAIICMEPVPEWVGAEVRDWIRQVVGNARLLGDRKVYFVPLHEDGPLLEESDYIDGKTHPTKEGSRKIADYLKDKVAAILGWQ